MPVTVLNSNNRIRFEVLSIAAGCIDINAKPVCADQPFYITSGAIKNSEYRVCQQDARQCDLPYRPEISYNDRIKDPLPITNVTWKMAQNFCVKLGGTLPTETQWMIAANQITDMGQAINEWVATLFEADGNPDDVSGVNDASNMVIRGDAAHQGANRLTQREKDLAALPNENRGFRCVFRVSSGN
jgi:formylglycine-generating enzyme required for sulfatase activity